MHQLSNVQGRETPRSLKHQAKTWWAQRDKGQSGRHESERTVRVPFSFSPGCPQMNVPGLLPQTSFSAMVAGGKVLELLVSCTVAHGSGVRGIWALYPSLGLLGFFPTILRPWHYPFQSFCLFLSLPTLTSLYLFTKCPLHSCHFLSRKVSYSLNAQTSLSWVHYQRETWEYERREGAGNFLLLNNIAPNVGEP